MPEPGGSGECFLQNRPRALLTFGDPRLAGNGRFEDLRRDMMGECRMIDDLRALTRGRATDHGLAAAAAAALRMLSDIDEAAMSSHDVAFLNDLVEEVFAAGNQSLFDSLRDGALDCRMCAALAAHAEALRRKR